MNLEKQKANRAIITLTKGGMDLGLKLLKEYEDTTLFINKRFKPTGERVEIIKGSIKELIEEIFHEYKCLIFIMATGIVVRTIAPYLQSKALDPAVIVMDEKGRNVISLLSGHLGRANEITLDIARRLKSNPVITTASDVNNSLAVDTLAMELGLSIDNLKDATKITSHIVNGESVGIQSQIKINLKLPDNITVLEKDEDSEGLKGIIYITNEMEILKHNLDKVVLRPRNLIIGVGCRKGKPAEEIIEAIKVSLDKVRKSEASIKEIATIDVKKDEEGIIEAAGYYKVPLSVIEREEVRKIEKDFETSDFVRNAIGVGAVAEPVAFIASEDGEVIMKKTRFGGITIAIVEEGVV
ncbi:cobalt-precorrin 5A hydrolase [Wukongibacter baidiensis]